MRDNRGEREVIYFASEPRCILDIPLTMTSLKSYVEGLRYLDEELLRQPSCLLLTGLALLLFLSPSLFISLHLPLCAHLIRSVSSLLRSSAPPLLRSPALLISCFFAHLLFLSLTFSLRTSHCISFFTHKTSSPTATLRTRRGTRNHTHSPTPNLTIVILEND